MERNLQRNPLARLLSIVLVLAIGRGKENIQLLKRYVLCVERLSALLSAGVTESFVPKDVTGRHWRESDFLLGKNTPKKAKG